MLCGYAIFEPQFGNNRESNSGLDMHQEHVKICCMFVYFNLLKMCFLCLFLKLNLFTLVYI